MNIKLINILKTERTIDASVNIIGATVTLLLSSFDLFTVSSASCVAVKTVDWAMKNKQKIQQRGHTFSYTTVRLQRH